MIYLAPFADPDGDIALYVPLCDWLKSRVSNDPRVAALAAAGFHHYATHGHCAVMLPADLDRATAVLAAVGFA